MWYCGMHGSRKGGCGENDECWACVSPMTAESGENPDPPPQGLVVSLPIPNRRKGQDVGRMCSYSILHLDHDRPARVSSLLSLFMNIPFYVQVAWTRVTTRVFRRCGAHRTSACAASSGVPPLGFKPEDRVTRRSPDPCDSSIGRSVSLASPLTPS